MIAGNIKQVQSPADGVISEIYVQNSQRAEKDQGAGAACVRCSLRLRQYRWQSSSTAHCWIQRRLEAELRGEAAFTPAADDVSFMRRPCMAGTVTGAECTAYRPAANWR